MKHCCNTLHLVNLMTRLQAGWLGINSQQRRGFSSGYKRLQLGLKTFAVSSFMLSWDKEYVHLSTCLRGTGIFTPLHYPGWYVHFCHWDLDFKIIRSHEKTWYYAPFVPDKLDFPPHLQFIISFLFFPKIRRKHRETFLIIQKHGKRADCIKEVESFGILQLKS
jgi:hypothetical protein